MRGCAPEAGQPPRHVGPAVVARQVESRRAMRVQPVDLHPPVQQGLGHQQPAGRASCHERRKTVGVLHLSLRAVEQQRTDDLDMPPLRRREDRRDPLAPAAFVQVGQTVLQQSRHAVRVPADAAG